MLLFVFIFLSHCGGQGTVEPDQMNETSNPPIASEGENPKESQIKNNSIVKYYEFKDYDPSKKKYNFTTKYELTESDTAKKGFFYKVFLDKKTNKVLKEEEYKNHLLLRTKYYDYDAKGNRTACKSIISFANAKVMEFKGKFKDDIFYQKDFYDLNKELRQMAEIRYYPDKGKVENYYTPLKELTTKVFFNTRNQPVRTASYRNGQPTGIINWLYTKEDHLLKRQVYFTGKKRPIKRIDFYYFKDTGNLDVTATYDENDRIKFKTIYDKETGREEQIEEYDQTKRKVAVAKIKYHKNGKDIQWSNIRYNRVISLDQYDEYDRPKRKYKYDVSEREAAVAIYDYGKSGLAQIKYFSYGKLSQKDIYDTKQNLKRVEYYSDEDLKTYSTFTYDPTGRIKEKVTYTDSNKPLKKFYYYYDKTGRMALESVLDGSNTKLVDKAFTYDDSGNIGSIKYFKNKVLVKREVLNSKGQVVRRERGNGGLLLDIVEWKYKRGRKYMERHLDRQGNVIRTMVFSYNSKGQIKQEDGYDRRGQYLGTRKFTYNENGWLMKEEFYNHMKKPQETIIYDSKGNVVSSQKHQTS